MRSAPAQPFRPRRWYALAIALTILTGLACRSEWAPLSAFASKYGGDALWALVVFLGFGFLFPRAPTLRIAALALAFAFAVEFSQLYHAEWIDDIRRTLFGRLVLGFTFNAPDLLAYAAGILLGGVGEAWTLRRFSGVSPTGRSD